MRATGADSCAISRLFTCAAIALPSTRSVRAASPALKTVRLGRGLVAVLGPDSNAVAADAGDGVLLVDGGDAAWSADLLQTVGREFTAKPIAALLDTHWHPEHTGSNAAVGAKGGEIIAHENTAGWLGTEVWVRWSDKRYPALPKVAQPTRTFYDSGVQRVGNREIDCVYLPKSHTDGDVAVLFREENVLVTGGTVSERRLADARLVDRRLDGWAARRARYPGEGCEQGHDDRAW